MRKTDQAGARFIQASGAFKSAQAALSRNITISNATQDQLMLIDLLVGLNRIAHGLDDQASALSLLALSVKDVYDKLEVIDRKLK
jgi:hypothetical protein